MAMPVKLYGLIWDSYGAMMDAVDALNEPDMKKSSPKRILEPTVSLLLSGARRIRKTLLANEGSELTMNRFEDPGPNQK
jgi:hypothetical protein